MNFIVLLAALVGLTFGESPSYYSQGPINPCEGNPCGDPSATCHKTGTTYNSYKCTCPIGQTYSYSYGCEAPQNPCAGNPCGDPKATCHKTGSSLKDFKCTCPSGQTYSYTYGCEAPLNPCAGNPCGDPKATCHKTGSKMNDFKCTCPSGETYNYSYGCEANPKPVVVVPKPKPVVVVPKPKPVVVKPSTPRGRSLGCFRDRGSRDLNGPKKWWNGNTPQNCVSFCYGKGYKYAGVQYTNQCFCANRYGKYGRANNCNMRCAGNRSLTCGGTWANSVYTTGRGGGRPNRPKPSRRGPRSVGCFRDKGRRAMNGPKKWWGGCTPQRCVNFCRGRGKKYAGVQYSSQCFCSNSYARYGRANNCNMKCAGNRSLICGGSWANSVYATGR